jgi:hypothetical protein
LKKWIIVFILLCNSIIFIFSDNTADPVKDHSITAAFGDYRWDHFHTGVDMINSEKKVRSFTDGEVIFSNMNRPRSINYGNGNFVLLENSSVKKRYSYSHMRSGSVDGNIKIYKKGDIIGDVGDSGHSIGEHIHFEIEDMRDKILLNPLNELNVNDTLKPRIMDIYFVNESGEKISIMNNYRIVKGGRLFIKCSDSMNGSPYSFSPYKITVIIDGTERYSSVFDRLQMVNGDFYLRNNMSFKDIYANGEEFDYYLFDFTSLPRVIGFKAVVEDKKGNKTEYKRPLKIIMPEN